MPCGGHGACDRMRLHDQDSTRTARGRPSTDAAAGAASCKADSHLMEKFSHRAQATTSSMDCLGSDSSGASWTSASLCEQILRPLQMELRKCNNGARAKKAYVLVLEESRHKALLLVQSPCRSRHLAAVEVEDEDRVIRRDQDVARVQVAVQYAQSMDAAQRLQEPRSQLEVSG